MNFYTSLTDPQLTTLLEARALSSAGGHLERAARLADDDIAAASLRRAASSPVESLHQPTLSHTCSTCHKSYKDATSLRRHQRSHGPPEFSCTVCSRQFKRRDALTRHVAGHSGRKKWICKGGSGCKEGGCGTEFVRKEGLQRHQARIGAHTVVMLICDRGLDG